ncbi:MAG: amidohydrolase family protein, partial [Kiloniellales bacterium]
GGAQALGRRLGGLAAGNRADLLVLDGEAPSLLGRSGDALLDAFVFAGNDNPVREVMVGGRWLVRDRAHRDEAAIFARYRAALGALAT